MDFRTPGLFVHHKLPEITQTHDHWVSDAIQPSHPLSSPSPPSFNLSQHQGLFNGSVLHIRDQIMEFHLQHLSFKWIFRVDFLWIDWFDLLAAQGTLKSLLMVLLKVLSRVFSSTTTEFFLQHSAFFMIQLSRMYMTIGKTIAFTRWTFVSKVISRLFNMLSTFVIAFLPRNKRLLISWLQSLFTVILEPK